MKNILIVFTGGTIGSTAGEGTIKPSEIARFKLIDEFQRRYPNHQDISFSTLQPIRILSENLAPAVWKLIIDAVESEQPERHDGIIVTHGTDTLAYTAAALSLYFSSATQPILLVSSDYPLEHPKANGLENFICAVEFILQIKEPGVFVPYRNQQQTTQVHRGARLASSLQLSGDFFSVQGQNHMQFNGRQFSRLGRPVVRQQARPPKLRAEFSDCVLMIKPYPGLDYTHINLDGVDAVLHELYHSGTACATAEWGENHSLLVFLGRCRQHGITVFLAPAVKSPDAYESTRFLLDAGAEMIWNMSMEAAYVKLSLAYGNFHEDREIIDFIDADIAGEHV